MQIAAVAPDIPQQFEVQTFSKTPGNLKEQLCLLTWTWEYSEVTGSLGSRRLLTRVDNGHVARGRAHIIPQSIKEAMRRQRVEMHSSKVLLQLANFPGGNLLSYNFFANKRRLDQGEWLSLNLIYTCSISHIKTFLGIAAVIISVIPVQRSISSAFQQPCELWVGRRPDELLKNLGPWATRYMQDPLRQLFDWEWYTSTSYGSWWCGILWSGQMFVDLPTMVKL